MVPAATSCPSATSTRRTLPARPAAIRCSVFIASTTTSTAPASTRSPTRTATRRTIPGNGDTVTPSAAAPPAPAPDAPDPDPAASGPPVGERSPTPGPGEPAVHTPSTVRVPLGRVFGARSGDKGGTANVGVWARNVAGYRFLEGFLTVERFRELIPEAGELVVQRHELPNLRALNFVVVGLLGEGVSSSTRVDPQAKGLGEWLRARVVELPAELLDTQGG